MRTRAATYSFVLLTCVYLAWFLWVDWLKGNLQLGQLVGAMPVLLTLAAWGWVARFCRWQWLMRRTGNRPPLMRALLAYLAGFAFTATPGKVGELVRIRYFTALGVPAWKVFAAFVYERGCDLFVVLLLASLTFQDSQLVNLAIAFVAAALLGVALFASRPVLLSVLLARLQRRGFRRVARLLRLVRDGLSGCRVWFNPLDILLSLALGLAAWIATSLSLIYLLSQMGIALTTLSAIGIYPLAMLVGAASMLPGGVGTTEATMITLLSSAGVHWQVATLAAVGVRLATLWFAIGVGLLAVILLESRGLSTIHNQACIRRVREGLLQADVQRCRRKSKSLQDVYPMKIISRR